MRGIPSKGLKAQLTARLSKVLEEEEAEEKKNKQIADAAAKQEVSANDSKEGEKTESGEEVKKDESAKSETVKVSIIFVNMILCFLYYAVKLIKKDSLHYHFS